MAKIGRSNMVYVKLPDSIATKTVPEAKLQAALNITVPKELERYAPKILDKLHDEITDLFHKEIKKRVKKLNDDDE